MTHLMMVLIALALDAVFGDPDWLWTRLSHPAALMGRAVAAFENLLNHGRNRRLKGVATLVILVTSAALLGGAIAALPLGPVWQILLAAILLAQNSLMRHVGAVARGLEIDLLQGRAAVQMIVGRDAAALDQSGVARSAIESGAENFSDGVVAPAFWFLLFGLPGIMVYKVVNTADSMIGYRTDRYGEFGWASARFDDLLNWIPARVSGALICAVHGSTDAVRVMLANAPLHRSPNAGWPEAATAAVLGVAISGPRTYDGQMTTDPFVNPDGNRYLNARDIDRAVAAIWRGWLGLVAILVVGAILNKVF